MEISRHIFFSYLQFSKQRIIYVQQKSKILKTTMSPLESTRIKHDTLKLRRMPAALVDKHEELTMLLSKCPSLFTSRSSFFNTTSFLSF